MASPNAQPASSSRAHVALTALGIALAVAVAAWGLWVLPRIEGDEAVSLLLPWVPALGVALAFQADGLAIIFVLLIGGIGAFIFLYSGAYLKGHPYAARTTVILIAFMASMLGVVLADDLIVLFVFWELTTITSYLLIGFSHEQASARRAALQGLLVTGAGALAMLAGLVLMAQAVGSYRISTIVATGDWLRAHPDYPLILALVLAGAFTKSAQFPFHFWLPNAMAAPTPVSAYLHSATMVKAGVYLLARFHPVLAGTEAWLFALTIAGGITAVHAAIQALRQTDLKLALAYTTVVSLGLLVMFLGADTPVAMVAALTFIVVHALYKSALFLVIGIIDHECGTRDFRRLGGIARGMPITAVACALAALSMAGFPPFLGFIGKELKYEGALAIYDEPALAVAAVLAANALMTALAGVIVVKVFFSRRLESPQPPRDGPAAMWLGPALLAVLGLVLGVMPELIGGPLIQKAVTGMLTQPKAVELALWHGFNVPLALSVATFVSGAALFLLHRRYLAAGDALARVLRFNADRAYDAVMAGFLRVAEWQTRVVQGTSLNRWLALTFAVIGLGLGWLLLRAPPSIAPGFADASALDAALALLVAAGAAATLTARSKLHAVCALGIVGVSTALVFLTYGAVDVAMTQLLVETLVLVIVALLLPRLPGLATAPRRGALRRLRDGVLAAAAGGVAATLAYAVSRGPLQTELTPFFEEMSVPGGHGRNIVNVILVDFRAIDTFGEVAVVVIAALAAFALLSAARRGGAR